MTSFILKYVATDKLLHFLISYGLTLSLIVASRQIVIPMLIVLAIGIIKEVLDSRSVGNFFSIGDLVADILGVIVAGLIGLLI